MLSLIYACLNICLSSEVNFPIWVPNCDSHPNTTLLDLILYSISTLLD